MINILLAVLLAATATAPALAARRTAAPAEEPAQENWSTLKMEATAIMGELKYQHGDHAGAQETFRDSLNSSKQVLRPHDHVVGLDLYRTAELAARRGDFDAARQHLDILIHRFPDTEFAQKGESLLRLLPKAPGAIADDFDSATPVVTGDQPEFLLGRIQAAARAGQDSEALEICRQFLTIHPQRPQAQEVRLLGAALYLRMGDAAGAERSLAFLAANAADAEVRATAIHLLAATRLSRGDAQGAAAAVPNVAPRQAFSDWLSRAQVFGAAAEQRLGRRSAALARYQRFIDSRIESPVRAQALAAIAADWDQRGKPAAAAEILDRAFNEASRWGMEELRDAVDLARAHEHYKLGRLGQAASLYSAFARNHPTHPQQALALYQQGLALKRLGQRERAAAAFSELVDKSPASVYAADAYLQLGQLYTDLGAADKAVAAYQRMAQSAPAGGQRESQLLIAQVHYNQKRFNQAIAIYWDFLESHPADARRRQIEDLLLTAYWLGARNDDGLLKAIELFPDHAIVAHIRWELGALAYKAGNHEKAARLFDGYAARYPRAKHAAESLFYLAQARHKMGEPQRAVAALKRLLAQYSKSPQARQAQPRLAAALYDSGDFDGAAKAYLASAAGKTAADDLFNAALSLSKAGRQSAAAATYERLLTKFPRHPKASLAWLYVAQSREAAGNLSAAAQAYRRVSTDADQPAALFAAGRIHEKLKQMALARRDYEALRLCRPAADPTRLRGLMRLGLLYELDEKPLKAMPLYHEVLKLSARGAADFQAALDRLQALSKEGAVARPGAR